MSEKPLHILHLEDDERDAELVRAALRADHLDFTIEVVSTGAQFRVVLDRGRIDLILSDFKLPSFDGLSALKLAREKRPDVPFIFVSGNLGEESAIDSLKNGATDYVLKHRLTRLAPAVRRALGEAGERRKREQAEETLDAQNQFLEALLDNVGVGIVACDSNGTLTVFNRVMRELHGAALKPVPAEAWARELGLYRGDGKTLFEKEEFPLYRALQGERIRNEEIAMAGRDGPARAMVVNGQPIQDVQGRKLGAVVVLQDVTERRKLEEQFRQSQKMEAIGRLAGGVAHDFNNLLTAIIGYSQMLISRLRPGDPACRDAEEIERAGTRAASLTRHLLAFSRQQVMRPRVLDLNAVLTDMEMMLRRLIGEDIDFLVVPGTGMAHVNADPGQIEQVIVNLAVNARDAMPRGGKLTMETTNAKLDEAYTRTRPGLAPGQYVMLAVTDTGVGMAAEIQSRIFEPFFTTKEVGKGTGLGLSTVHGIIQQSAGHVEVYSEPGRGSCFKLYLPAVQEPVEQSPEAGPPSRPEGGVENVLLAEDDELVRSVVSQTLRQSGYTVVETHDGLEALHHCERAGVEIDLLVTDVTMPVMSGVDLSKRVAALRPGIKVLYTSGYADQALVHQELLAPGTAFLQKPFTPDALLRKVREVLDQPASAAA
ncbi:MAG TPA: response regulator [Candidatus Eisenbacteria bacterium]